uniref:Protein AAR2 homolog n=1 Tax=Schistocephalus solidus TaxID=70667 RepID=A0A0V0J765_SCHSO
MGSFLKLHTFLIEFQDEPEADIDREILLSRPTEISMFLAKYPKERLADWISLSSHLTASIADRLQPTGRYIYSCAQFQSEKSNSQDRASVPIPERLLRGRVDSIAPESLAECEAQLPALKTMPETDLRLTVLPAHPLYPAGASPTEISLHNMDQTYTLNALLGQIETSIVASQPPMDSQCSHGLSPAEAFLLGEIQFSFVVFLLGEALEGWYHWRGILTLLASCEKAISEHPHLYKALITCLYRELTFTGDETTEKKDNDDHGDDSLSMSDLFHPGSFDGWSQRRPNDPAFLPHTLSRLFSNIAQASNNGDKALMDLVDRAEGLRKSLERKFGVSLSSCIRPPEVTDTEGGVPLDAYNWDDDEAPTLVL